MACRGPQCVARALQNLSISPGAQPTRPAKKGLRTARIATLSASRTCQRLNFSQTSLRCVAAPPIDFDKPTAIPVRVLPASPAYFTGAPKYTDQLREVEELHAKYAFLPTVPAGEAPRMAWVKLPQFRGRVGEVVPSAKYKRVIKLLQRLNRIPRSMAPPEVLKIMDKFLRPGNPYQREAPPQVLDNMGRARGVGRRKTASAQVWLVEGDGEVMINGRNIVEMFPRLHDRESALWPLKSTDRMDKYNVFALVRGGGVTGQAEAITVALGRALMVHEPALKPVLRRAGVVKMDPRQVERKKAGRLKARKKPAWVRR